MIPKELISDIKESELTVSLVNGADISVVGMDKPERVEGRPLDFILLDEYADMKPNAWSENVRPALSTIGRPGRAIFTGVPAGRNHYYRLALEAQNPEKAQDWDYFHWTSAEILDAEEIRSAKETLDPLTYEQEYEASFLNFEGRAYYSFKRDIHARETLQRYYNRNTPLVFAFDFNVSPGVAAVIQDFVHPVHGDVTGVIDQVWVPNNSNSEIVAKKLIELYGSHAGEIHVYGDATGGARGTAKVEGSDWDIIRGIMRPHYGDRYSSRVPRQNPPERVRVNSVNARLKTADDKIHLLVCPVKAPKVVEDFEGTTLIAGGSGELDKKADAERTHISDAVGYFVVAKHPMGGGGTIVTETY